MMSRKHHKDSPAVKDFQYLYLRDHPDITPIILDSSQWFAWLLVADLFSVVTPNKDLTVRKERRGSNLYWYIVTSDSNGKIVKKYLGKSETLTSDKLKTSCEKLLASIAM